MDIKICQEVCLRSSLKWSEDFSLNGVEVIKIMQNVMSNFSPQPLFTESTKENTYRKKLVKPIYQTKLFVFRHESLQFL